MRKISLTLIVAVTLSIIVLSVAVPVNHSSVLVSQPAINTMADGGTPLPPPPPPQQNVRQRPSTTLMADGGTPLPPPPPPQQNVRSANRRERG